MATKTWNLFERYDEIRQRTGTPPVLQAAHYERAIARGDGQTEFVMSTGGVKRDGFEIVQSGWQFNDKAATPAPWRHSTVSPRDAMGIWARVWKSNANGAPLHLRGLLQWNTAEHNPDAPYVHKMFDDGILRACSVRWEEADKDAVEPITPDQLASMNANVDRIAQLYGGARFLRSLLIECSPCMLGLDKDALSVRMRSGDIPEGVLDRFVVRPGDRSEMSIPGREVLLLDGHPVQFEVDRPTTVDLASTSRTSLAPGTTATDANGNAVELIPDTEGDAVAIAAAAVEAAKQPSSATSGDPAEHRGDGEGMRAMMGIGFGVHGKCPVAEGAWDGGAARKALRTWADGKMSQYKKGFAVIDGDPANLTSYKFIHHTIEDGKLVAKRRGIYAAAQRIMQGNSPAGEDAKPHIAAEYSTNLGETAPWKKAKGRAYELLHAQLRVAAEDEDVAAIRQAIEQIGTDLFGDVRLREAWEPRQWPEGPASMWAAVSDLLCAAVDVVDVDQDERDARIDILLTDLSTLLAPLTADQGVRVWATAAVTEIARALDLPCEIGNNDHLAALVGAVRARPTIGQPTPPAPEPAPPPTVDLAVVAERLRERFPAKASAPNKETLLSRVTGGSGAAGASKT